MNKWEIAAVVIAAAMLPCLGVAVFAGAEHALAAAEVTSALLTSVLLVLSQGFTGSRSSTSRWSSHSSRSSGGWPLPG
ncbi:MAG: hypothetical protein M3065_10705 [Actinomycetota bacterium]|nr:hypothetical protein [Actinomycetota bacterium]